MAGPEDTSSLLTVDAPSTASKIDSFAASRANHGTEIQAAVKGAGTVIRRAVGSGKPSTPAAQTDEEFLRSMHIDPDGNPGQAAPRFRLGSGEPEPPTINPGAGEVQVNGKWQPIKSGGSTAGADAAEAGSGWGSRAWQGIKSVFTRAGSSATAGAETAVATETAEVAGVGLGTKILAGIGGPIVGTIPGLIETGQGIMHGDGRKIAAGTITVGTGAASIVVGTMAGTALVASLTEGALAGAAIGTLVPIPIVGTVGGIIVGGALALAGSWAAHKAVDAIAGPAHAVKGKIELTKDQALALWGPLHEQYEQKLKAAESATKENAEKLAKEAQEAGNKLYAYLGAIGDKGYISKDVAAQKRDEVKTTFAHTVEGLEHKLTAGVAKAGHAVAGALGLGAGHGAGGHEVTHHMAAVTPERVEAVRTMQGIIGLTGADADGKLGSGTRKALLAAGIIKSLDEIPLPAHGIATDTQLKNFFATHADALADYAAKKQAVTPPAPTETPTAPSAQLDAAVPQAPAADAAPTAPQAPAAAAPQAPADAAAPAATTSQAPADAAPVTTDTRTQTPADRINSDPLLQAALANLSSYDIAQMNEGKGPGGIGSLFGAKKLHEIGLNVYDADEIGVAHQYNDKRLQHGPVPAPGQDPTLATINILPEGNQRFSVTSADGTDITASASQLIDAKMIEQAQREHIGSIKIQEVDAGERHTFIFSPVKTPAADKGEIAKG